MKAIKKHSLVLSLVAALLLPAVYAQAPAPGPAPGQLVPGGPGGGGGGRGRGGLPGATPEQTQAIVDMTTALAPLASAVTTARNELATVTFAEVKNEAGIKAAVEKLRAAELALASKRADEFAKLQAGPNKLNPDQVAAFIAAGGNLPAGRGGAGPGRGGAPGGRGGDPAAGAGRGRGN